MAQPIPYSRAFNFSNYQAQNPTVPLPGGSLDEELSRVKLTTDQIRAVLKLIQRDDTALANDSVGFDQLKAEVSIGVNPPSAWAVDKNYVARDTVFTDSNFYICEISHISGVFANDLAAGKWTLIASFEAATSASAVTFNDSTASLGASTVQPAIEALKALHDSLVASVASLSAADITFTSSGLARTTGADVQGAVTSLDAALVSWGALPGEVKIWPGAALPAGYLWCNGAAVSRTTYAAVFAAIGTTHGVGDGSTTFNLPDYRDVALVGRGNMGGSARGLLSKFTSTVLGALFGVQEHQLTVGQLAKHTPVFTGDPLADHFHMYGANFVGSGTSSNGGYVSPGTNNVATSSASAGTPSGTISQIGNDEAHPNVQPSAVVNFIIKT